MLYFFIQNASPGWDVSGLRSGGCEMTIFCSDMFGLSSDYPRISSDILESSLYRRKQGFCGEILNSEFRGRRSIW